MECRSLTTNGFTSAKHAPPACLTELIDRTGLLATIGQERHKRLLFIQAPAGYGKTILLAQWRNLALRSGARVAWVSCEKADKPAERFVTSIASALANAGCKFAEPFLTSRQRLDANGMLHALLSHAENTAEETWLILDDWHLVQCEAVTDLMESLLRHMPATWHVAISSRTRPHLNLLALRARGQVIKLGRDELRFGHDEIKDFLSAAALPAASLTQLEDMTEGWAIALQLARLWLEKKHLFSSLERSFITSIDGMAEYLAAEVFSEMSPGLRDFVLESSICSSFNAELADAIRDRDDAVAHLEALKSLHGLAIPLDEQQQWYRLHRIFAEFLESERCKLNPGRVSQLHAHAANWFEQQGLLFEAVGHAKLSGDETRTINLVENAGCVDICIRTGAPAVRSLLDNLPSDAVWQRPRLRAAHTAMNLKLGSIAEAERALADLRSSLNPDAVDAALERDLLVVENLRLCFIDKNPTLEDLSAHRRQIDHLTGSDWWLDGLMYNAQGRLEMRSGRLNEAVQSLARAYQIFDAGGSSQGRFFMSIHLAICHLFLGSFTAAENAIKQARHVLERQLDSGPAYTAIAHVVDALLLYERNELAAAASAAHLGLAGLEHAEGCFEQYLISTYVAATVAFSTSGMETAMRVIERGRRLARYHGLTRLEDLLDCLSARLLINAGHWESATSLASTSATLRSVSTDTGWIELDFATPVRAQIELFSGRIEEARTFAAAMIVRSRASGRVPAEIRAHLLMAIACAADDTQGDVRTSLRHALELATAETIVQPFFEFDERLLRLLRDFQRTDLITLPAPQANFLSGLVLRMIAAGKAKNNKEPLTAREREILTHLTQGSSNKAIARALDLTENAVKFHLKNIFRKLGVESRAMAAAVAERMSLESTLAARPTAPASKAHH